MYGCSGAYVEVYDSEGNSQESLASMGKACTNLRFLMASISTVKVSSSTRGR